MFHNVSLCLTLDNVLFSFQVLEDLIIALKIVAPDSNKNSDSSPRSTTSSTDENKENIVHQSDSATPMDGVIEGGGNELYCENE